MNYRILYILILFNVLLSETAFGYLRETEMSFCMNECAQYYIETEIDPGFGVSSIIPGNDSINMDIYLNRFVEVELGDEINCIECSATEINSIEFSDDCMYPVSCFIDPCQNALCDLYPLSTCESNYCGGCNADFYDLQNNLIDCSNIIIEECYDLQDAFFGACDMFLGYAVVNGSCEGISGCSWENNGIDYSNSFFNSFSECLECFDTGCSHDEVAIEGINSSSIAETLCFNSYDIAYLQTMIDNSYQSGIDLNCEGEDPYCGSPNPYMNSDDSWFWKTIDGEDFYFANNNSIVEPLELGIQEWENGRLISILCGSYIYCQLSGDFPEIEPGQLSEINTFRFEYNFLSGTIPESLCELELNYHDYLGFDLTGNLLCPPYPECIDNIGFQNISECPDNLCEDIANDYNQFFLGDENTECNYNNDCISIWGNCDVGLGGCHYSINHDNYISSEIDTFVNLWVENNCMEGVCDCLSLPNSICVDNSCELAYCYETNPVGCFVSGCPQGYECIDTPDNCTPSSCFCDDSSFYGFWTCTEDCSGGTCVQSLAGDVNYDGFLNIADIVIIVNMILGLMDVDLIADMNQDNNLDVIDIIQIVSIILED